MKLRTEREQVKDVLARWTGVYGLTYKLHDGRTSGAVANELAKLNPDTATAADVAAVIGNSTWVEPAECDECGVLTPEAVQLGQEPDYESSTAVICRRCLVKALALLDSAPSNEKGPT